MANELGAFGAPVTGAPVTGTYGQSVTSTVPAATPNAGVTPAPATHYPHAISAPKPDTSLMTATAAPQQPAGGLATATGTSAAPTTQQPAGGAYGAFGAPMFGGGGMGYGGMGYGMPRPMWGYGGMGGFGGFGGGQQSMGGGMMPWQMGAGAPQASTNMPMGANWGNFASIGGDSFPNRPGFGSGATGSPLQGVMTPGTGYIDPFVPVYTVSGASDGSTSTTPTSTSAPATTTAAGAYPESPLTTLQRNIANLRQPAASTGGGGASGYNFMSDPMLSTKQREALSNYMRGGNPYAGALGVMPGAMGRKSASRASQMPTSTAEAQALYSNTLSPMSGLFRMSSRT